MRRRQLIIAYDVVASRRRRRLLRVLQSWSLGGQYSLFECRLTDAEAEELFLQLSEMISPEEDKLLFAWLDAKQDCVALTQATSISFDAPSVYLG
ncbi:MAG: CRISPR-associated endonuclease Cas2 [Thiotrichales bacterium]